MRQGQTTTQGTTCPTLFENCVALFWTGRLRFVNNHKKWTVKREKISYLFCFFMSRPRHAIRTCGSLNWDNKTHKSIWLYLLFCYYYVCHQPLLRMPLHVIIQRNISFTFISEFDQFLADRAAAGGQRTGSVKSGASRPRQRQMQMENQADDEMFGLWFTCTNTIFFQTLV